LRNKNHNAKVGNGNQYKGLKELGTKNLHLILYFFLKPAGHFGFTAVTFLLVLPLTQVIVTAFATGLAEALGVGVGSGAGGGASCSSFTLIVGDE
jgi:hypothetical protein